MHVLTAVFAPLLWFLIGKRLDCRKKTKAASLSRVGRLLAIVALVGLFLAASLMLLAPQLPLLFMGEEYGERNPFLFFCSFADAGLIENVRSGRRRDS